MAVVTDTFTGTNGGSNCNHYAVDMSNCALCGEQLTGKRRKFCSRRCGTVVATRRHRLRNPWQRLTRENDHCATCGESLDGRRSDAKFCSVACQQADRMARRKAEYQARVLAVKPPCEICGSALGLWGKRWCSTPCQSRAERYRQYGITDDDYRTMLAEQGGVCAICHTDDWGKGGSRYVAHIDHNHATGQVRGLLCFSCNTGLGSLKDDPERLRSALAYLERFEAPCPS